MEWLQSLLDTSTTPAVTAFLLGLLTALSPCPLATNIAAIGFIAKHIDSGRSAFVKGLLYTAGRMLAYTLLGVLLIALLRSGASVFGVSKVVAEYGEMIIGPVLLVAGLYMLLAAGSICRRSDSAAAVNGLHAAEEPGHCCLECCSPWLSAQRAEFSISVC